MKSFHFGLGLKTKIKRIYSWLENKYLIDHVYPGLLIRMVPLFYKRIEYHYGADYRWFDEKSQNIDPRTSNLGYGLIHYAIVRNQKPKRILCVGSMYGFIPFMLARACQDNKIGHVDFVDAAFDMDNPKNKFNHIYGRGFWKRTDPKQHFSQYLHNTYISTHVMTLEEFFKKHPQRTYDYIYLDGDHRYQGARRAVLQSWKHLNEEGYLCLHDIHFKVVADGITFGQWKVWQELTEKSNYKMEFTNHYSGIGIVQKISKPRKMFTYNFDQDPTYHAWRKGI